MKKVLITGASRGPGRALAIEISKRNYGVIAAARNRNDIDEKDKIKSVFAIDPLIVVITPFPNRKEELSLR